MDLNIEVSSPHGKRLDMFMEEEDGHLYIEVRDWETGDTEFEFEFQGTLGDFRAKIGVS